MGRRGIFIKMFVWFWLVMAVVIAIIIALDRMTESGAPGTPMEYALSVPLTNYGRAAAAAADKGDDSTLSSQLEHLESSTGIKPYLFDGNLTEVSGCNAPHEVVKLAARARATGKAAFIFSHNKMLGAVPVTSDRNRQYIIAGVIPGEPVNSTKEEMLFLLPRLAIVLVISCLACYLLARYMTSPIIKLRSAARQLASGDLQARISPAAEKRWDEIGELAHDFDLMAERIRQLLASQQQLLGNISHELRSPLARLNVALEIAHRHSPPEAGKSLDRIEWEAERLNEMIGQVLTLTRLQSGMEKPKKERIDLGRLVQEIADDADFEAKGRNRSVRLVENDSCSVVGAKDLLHSAIENVVRNAVWYTEEGTTVDISLKCSADKRSAVVSVRDRGPGVPEGALANLFKPFYRVDKAREPQTGGTGLGLAITERAVLLHGGQVKAVNFPVGGLLVEISLSLV